MVKINTYYGKIRTLLISIGAIFLVLFLILLFYKYKLEKQIFSTSQKELCQEVNSLLSINSAATKQTMNDCVYWDELVRVIENKDTSWFKSNMTLVSTFMYDYYCFYNKKFEIVHQSFNNKLHSEVNIPKEAVAELNHTRDAHFFMSTSEGLLEVNAASIHPSDDYEHKKTEPSGYMVLMKKWDQEFIAKMSAISGKKITLLNITDSIEDGSPGLISTKKTLQGWDGMPVSVIVFSRITNLNFKATQNLMYIILVFVILVLVVFNFIARKWINRPLKLVSDILNTENVAAINDLKKAPAEFGRIGSLFEKYVLQKDELRHSKEKAEESDRLKTAFLANMSHEIRTPMNGILGFTELLKRPNLSGNEQQEYIRIIKLSGDRMLHIINDIICISRIEAGQMGVVISETNVNDQIEEIYAFFKPEAEQKGVQIFFKNALSGTNAIIESDSEKIYAILTNLVKNAIKFTNAGSIEFGYEKKGKYLEFFIKDTGVGIPDEKKEIVFERFRQGSESDSRNYQGAGLGLSISKAYVEILGGKIWIESVNEKGSEFYFTIPYNGVREENVVVKEVFSDDGVKDHARNLKILIAEDDETSQVLITLAVAKYGKEILTARTGVEAVEACRNNPDIDLVLMDILMPEMDGYEATRKIRQFNKEVVIVAQTAFALAEDRERALLSGCTDYLSKPIADDDLKAILQKHQKSRKNHNGYHRM